MRVITLNDEKFALACQRLMARVHSQGYEPDAVIGIITGGALVAEKIRGTLGGYNVDYSRPTSRGKKSICRGWLKKLPRPVLNFLRILESKCLTHHPKESRGDVPGIESKDYKRILLVDDAVDSGATLKAVTEALMKAMPQAQIKTAVITVTFRHPIVLPDFCLYNDGTLIRFPWSLDYRD